MGQENIAFLLIDKPLGWTSFAAVKKTMEQYNLCSAGHAGTLDPLASGLLIVCAGNKKKEMERFKHFNKEYTGYFVLGATTPTFDAEQAPVPHADYCQPATEQILHAAKSFLGNSLQIPPLHSAVKVKGKPAFLLARKGIPFTLPPRPIHIEQFEVEKIELPKIYFKIRCSKGTYIRSIANDFGLKLNTGAYLGQLRRTQIGPYHVDNALPL